MSRVQQGDAEAGAATPTPLPTPSQAPNPAAPRFLLWLVALGFFMQTLDSTIVNTALPAMAASLHESPLRMQSVVVAYSLTMATLIPATGWLADRFGTQRIFLFAIVLFTLGSAACAASVSLTQLSAARVLQGLGGACGAALLGAFTQWLGTQGAAHSLGAFRASFLAIGAITMASAGICWQLVAADAVPPRNEKAQP